MWQCRQGWLVLQFPSLGALCWLLGGREPHQGPGLPGHPPGGWKIKLCSVGLCEEGAGRPQGRRGRLKGEGRMQGPRRPHWELDQAPLNTPSLYPMFSAPRAYSNGFPLKPSLLPILPCSTGTPPSQQQNYSPKVARAFFPHSAPKPAQIKPCCRIPTVPSNIQNRHSPRDRVATGSGLAPFHHLSQPTLRPHEMALHSPPSHPLALPGLIMAPCEPSWVAPAPSCLPPPP